jgi:hypothetical protein
MAAVAVAGIKQIDGDDVHVFGTELDLPFSAKRNTVAGRRRWRSQTANSQGGLASHRMDDVSGVVATIGEGAFDDSTAAQRNLFDGGVGALDDEGFHAELIAVHDVNFTGRCLFDKAPSRRDRAGGSG